MIDLTKWGYAPGNYTIKCHTCGKRADGDKRAITCKQCACEKEINQLYKELNSQKALLDETTDALSIQRNKSEFWCKLWRDLIIEYNDLRGLSNKGDSNG